MMKRKLDAARIEEARRTTIKSDTKEAERREIQETISKNRRGERKVKVILPLNLQCKCNRVKKK